MSEQTNQSEQHLTEEQWEQVNEISRKIMKMFGKDDINPFLSIHALEQVVAINLYNLEYMTGNDALRLAKISSINIGSHINRLREKSGYKTESLN